MKTTLTIILLLIVTVGCKEKPNHKKHIDWDAFSKEIKAADMCADSMQKYLKDSAMFYKYHRLGQAHLQKAKNIVGK